MYSTRTRIHARIPNEHPREEKRTWRVSDKSPRTSRRRSSCMSGSWRAERAGRLPCAPRQSAFRADFRARRTRRLPHEDPRAEVGEEVRVGVSVGVRVGPVEFKR